MRPQGGSYETFKEALMRPLLFALVIFVGVPVIGTPAKAHNYPWCARYSGGGSGGGENCGFSTYQQCMADVSGIGGFCQLNNTYVPPAGSRPFAQRKSHKQS